MPRNVWHRGANETDAEYADRVAQLDALFPTPPPLQEARSTASLTDYEMAALRASRTPPEHDYDAG